MKEFMHPLSVTVVEPHLLAEITSSTISNADLQKVANGANAIRGNLLTLRKFVNVNTTKQMEYLLISADFRIFFGIS